MYLKYKKYIIKMKGLINEAINKGIKKGKSLKVIKRYLKAKYKITTSIKVLKERIKHGKFDQNG